MSKVQICSFKIPLTEEEKDWLKKEAGATGLSLTSLVKKRVFFHQDGTHILQNHVTGGVRDLCRKTHNLVQTLRLLSEKTADENVKQKLLEAAADGQKIFHEIIDLLKKD